MKKVLIVTGAGRGIGAAIARGAAREGYAVAINYHRDEGAAEALLTEIRAEGGEAIAVRGDVGNEKDVHAMFERTEAELGPVTAVVNNAGITSRPSPFTEVASEDIERIFRTNVHGVMFCSRAAIAAFRRHGQGGVIVNISSVAAKTGSPGEYVHYSASKAAVEAFTNGLARELAAENIRVCCVAPGTTLTDIHANMGDPDRPYRVAQRIPMQRPGKAEEIAAPVLWLLSPAASYITGVTLPVSGGL
ncbi:SDR family NAD(P)-dependent oxidoreductase [Massilia endophytica]|uniref:SDR family NAD(P)-dependent oxidoreductase n=1 Tax=Massilia endophytica TaxID=2899220 RepID=UPI001E32626C|nr:glucose 1-dehydrogenase [Massilia endophytica]UGQ46421.1 glucose 1-dehydrogenase [Massilia endophytica]